MDLTIAAQLAKFEDNRFSATDLIRRLLIYHTVTAELSAHLHLSRHVVLRCTQAFEAIHELMTTSHQQGTPLNWDIFHACTRAIPILERILLSFTTADSLIQHKHLPDDDDVLGALRFIAHWDQEKIQLVEALKELASDEFLALSNSQISESEVDVDTQELLHDIRSRFQSAPFSEIAQDDLTASMEVWDFFNMISSELSLYDAVDKATAIKILDMMRNISRDLHSQSLVDQNCKDNITQALSSPHYLFAQFFTKSMMLITIPFSLLSNNRSNPRLLDDDTKKMLAGEEIWNEMQRFTALLLEAVKDVNKRNNPKIIEDHYTSLWKLLLPTDDLLLDKKHKLLQLSTRIFRRFQQRSVELIRLLHFLDQESSTKNVSRDEIRKVFQETIELLEATEESFRGRSLRASVTDEEYSERAKEFGKMFSKIRQCGKAINPSNLWLSQEAEFLAAVERDEIHMNKQEQLDLS